MSLLYTAIKGMAWTTISTIVRSVVSLLQVSILTNYLEKTEFGIVAICTLFIGFSQIFLDLGFSIGIIHKQDITPRQYSSLFWFNIFSGIIITIVLCLISPIIANIYDEPSLNVILPLLSLTIFFSSIGNQHRTVQQKQMRFKYISIIEIITSLLTLTLAIILATSGYGIYSLVFSTLFNILFSNILFLTIGLQKDKNISFHFSLRDTFPFLKIGVFSVGTQILDYFSREIDIIFISATLGKDTLGVYSLCKKLVLAVYSAINPILTKVLSPMLAYIQKDINRVRNVYYNLTETIAIINFPIYFLIAIFSHTILILIYGYEYTEATLLLSLLAIYYGYLSTGNPIGSLQTALGRTDTGFYWTFFRITFNTLALYIGTKYSIEGAVISLFIINFLSQPLFWYIVVRPLIGGKFLEYLFKILRPFIIVIICSLPFYLIPLGQYHIIYSILLTIIFLLTYFSSIYKILSNSYIVTIIQTYRVNRRNNLTDSSCK